MIILLFHQINFFYIYLLPIFINIDFPNIFKHLNIYFQIRIIYS